MKIIQTLLEASNPFKSKNVSLEEAASFVAEECRHALNAPPIYVDAVSRSDALMVHPSNRKAINILEILVDETLESWNNYPKRTQSLVCSGLDGQYRVFPVDGAVLAYTRHTTFEEAFDRAHSTFTDIDVSFHNMIQIITNAYNMRMGGKKQVPEGLTSGHVKEFFQLSNDLFSNPKNRNINHIIEKAGGDDETVVMIRKILDLGHRDFKQGFEDLFSPDDTDIQTTSINQLSEGFGEIWTDAPSVLVHTKVLGKL